MGNHSTSFATDYKDLITFLYYVLSFSIQLAIFGVGTVYVLSRDNRRRKKDAKKERLRLDIDDRSRKEEQRKQLLQEWRKFSQELNLKYIDMTRDKVIQRLQHAAKESSKVCISPHISGLEVVKYMINDEDSFPNAEMVDAPRYFISEQRFLSTALDELRLDLRSVFVLLNYCWSLCLLGEIPANFNQEMRRIVIVLGNLALPFYGEESDGHRFRIIKACLEKFGENPRIPKQRGRKELTDEIPYVKFLRYEPDIESGKIFTFRSDVLCCRPEEKFFRKLNFDLVVNPSKADYARKFAKTMKERSNKWICVNATPDEMVTKLIHDVRRITWKKNQNVPLDQEDDDLLQTLKAVSENEELRPALCTHEAVKQIIEDFAHGVDFFEKNGLKDFGLLKDELNQVQNRLEALKIPHFVDESKAT